MKREDELEERQRALHAMVRALTETPPSADLPNPDETAALLSGALFDSELRLVENRILADDGLREEASALHAEFESGAVPRLVRRQRRSTEALPTRAGGMRFLRRQGPYFLALVVFVVVGVLPYSVRRCGGRAEHTVGPGSLALASRGSPRLIDEDGNERVIFAGAVLPPQARIRLATKDELRLLTAGGARRRLGAKGETKIGTANRELGELFTIALRNREARSVPLDTEEEGRTPLAAIIFPRGRLLHGDPEFRWSTTGGDGRVRLSVVDGAGNELFARALTANRWRYPATEAPLPRGRGYRVVLRDFGRGDVLAEAPFEIATAEEIGARAALRESLTRLEEKAPGILELEWLMGRGHLGEAFMIAERLLEREGDSIEVRERLAFLARRFGLRALAEGYEETVRSRLNRDG